MASASDLTESFYNACRGTFLFLRRFLRLISTPMNLYKGTKFRSNPQTSRSVPLHKFLNIAFLKPYLPAAL